MTTETTLIEKREELKRRLAAGEYKTLVDIFLEWFDRLLRRIIRRSRPLPIWLIIAILILVLALLIIAAIYFTGDLTAIYDYIGLYGIGRQPGLLLGSSFLVIHICAIFIMKQHITHISALWHDAVLDATESLISLEEFEYWLETAFNQRFQFLVIVVGGLLGGSYAVSVQSTQLGRFIGYGFAFLDITYLIISLAPFYLFWAIVFLSARLRRYDLKLFAADPASSELIARLSGVLSFPFYFFGFYAAIVAVMTSLTARFDTPFARIPQVFFLWLPLIVLFISNQTSLSRFITQVKWKTLNEIQAEVEKLQAAENFRDKETMEAINRLMDYHDRVKSTRNSALDLRTILGFINSLLLRLLAFLIGNFDKLIALLPQRP